MNEMNLFKNSFHPLNFSLFYWFHPLTSVCEITDHEDCVELLSIVIASISLHAVFKQRLIRLAKKRWVQLGKCRQWHPKVLKSTFEVHLKYSPSDKKKEVHILKSIFLLFVKRTRIILLSSPSSVVLIQWLMSSGTRVRLEV